MVEERARALHMEVDLELESLLATFVIYYVECSILEVTFLESLALL